MQSLGLKLLAPHIADHPKWIAISAILLTVVCAALTLNNTKFSGDITENLRNGSETYQTFRSLEENFHSFSNDETLLIRSKDLSDPSIYQDFQDFLLDLQFASQVEATFSIFSLPSPSTPNSDEAAGSFFLTSPDHAEMPINEKFALFRNTVPMADKLLSEDFSATLVMIMLAPSKNAHHEGLSPQSIDEIKALAAPYKNAFTLSFVGIPEIQRTIEAKIHKDQTRLTAASTLLCILVAGGLFRSWRGALICALPPVIGLVWYFGFLALFSIPVDFLTTIVPTMVVVVAFADGVHLYVSVQAKRNLGGSKKEAIAGGIATTGPACFLASLTTSLAFIGIGLGGAETMHRLSITGAVGVMLAFLAVILLLPTLAHFLMKAESSQSAPTAFFLQKPSRPAIWLSTYHRKPILAFAMMLSVILIAIHIALPATFRVTDYLAEDEVIRQDEQFIEAKLGGSGQLFAILSDPDGIKGISASDRDTFNRILTSLNKRLEDPVKPEGVLDLLQQFNSVEAQPQNPLLSRFISKDGLSYLVPIPLGSLLAAETITQYADSLKDQLAQDGVSSFVRLTGLSLLTARETPNLIRDLRSGLLSAIIIVIISIMIIVRSIRVGLAFVLPNLIPILTVEAFFWMLGRPLSMTAVVALTIAFGIAVDNSIHLLNQYRLARQSDPTLLPEQSMARAIAAITPAVIATTMLLVAGLSMSQLSSLPSVILFGQLVITALLVALIADLYLLPSFLLALERKPK